MDPAAEASKSRMALILLISTPPWLAESVGPHGPPNSLPRHPRKFDGVQLLGCSHLRAAGGNPLVRPGAALVDGF
jgi:hypothetical protein